MRFYNGTPVTRKSEREADELVSRYLRNARAANRRNLDYGGSTGGVKSIDGGRGLSVIKDRQARMGDLRKIFDQEGSGRFGARKEQWIAKQYDPEKHKQMRDRQSGLESEDSMA